MYLETKNIKGVDVKYRPGTSDERVLKEVIEGQCYRKAKIGFEIEEGEHWLDLGANIGAFAIYCRLLGATAECYEPDPENYKILGMNVPPSRDGSTIHPVAVTTSKEKRIELFKGSRPEDRYRYTVIKSTRPHLAAQNLYIGDLLRKNHGKSGWDGAKLDIEGAELAMLDEELFPRVKKLCMEYHLSKDRSMANFRRRMKFLRSRFKVVSYIPSLDQKYPDDTYPGFYDRLIFCRND